MHWGGEPATFSASQFTATRSRGDCECMTSNSETEVKIPLADRTAVLQRLGAAGFIVSVPRVFESNTMYDTPEQALRSQNMLLRLRQAGDHLVITWKGPGTPGPHKSRPEIETSVGSLEKIAQILEQLGYFPFFRYEKYRTELRNRDVSPGVVTLDETPIGDFMEIEGPAEWIDLVARQLGFTSADYILESYGKLYLESCRLSGMEPQNMVFASHHV